MAREIKLKISLDGSEKVDDQIDEIGDGLEEIAKKDAKNAKDALNDLNSTNLAGIRAQIKSVGETFQTIGGKIKNVGKDLTVGLTAPIIGLTLLIGTLGITYEQSLNTFQAVTKATSAEMKDAAKVAKDLGADIDLPATSAKDAALAMTELGKAGFTAKDAMIAARGVLQLAAAAQLDEAKAAEIAANALNSFNLKASDSIKVVDLLAAASNSSSSEVTDIAEAFQQASATFAAAKVPIEDLTTAIALMANAGVKGSDAGTSLKTFLASIQAPSTQGATALRTLGIEVFDLQGKMRSLPDLIGQFDTALSGLTDEKKVQAIDKIFGSDASRAAQILFKDGAKGFEEMKAAVTQTGAAADLAKAKTKGLGGAWEAFKSQAETIGITIFDALKGPAETGLRFLSDSLGKAGDFLSNLAENNPQLLQLGAIFVALAAALGPVLVVIGSIVAAVGTLLVTLAPVFTAVLAFVSLVAEAGLVATLSAIVSVVGGALVSGFTALLPVIIPVVAIIGAITAAIGLAIAAGIALYASYQTNFGGLRDFINEVWGGIKSFIQIAMSEISTFVSQILAGILAFWEQNGTEIMTAVNTSYNAIAQVVQNFLDGFRQFWEANGENITSIVRSTWEIIKAVVTAGVGIVLNVIKLVSAIINGDWSSAWEAAKAIISTVISAIGTILKGLVTIVYNIFAAIGNTIIAVGRQIIEKAVQLGKNIVLGIINGLGSLADAVYQKGRSIVSGLFSSMQSTAQTQSPSRVTIQLGKWIAEGLAVGMDVSADKVRKSARNLTNEIIKELRDAIKEFQKLAGASPEQVSGIQTADRIRQAISAQSEIIKLRKELGLNQFNPLPSTLDDTERELQFLQRQKQAVEDLKKANEELEKQYKDLQEAAEKAQKAFEDKLQGMRNSGALELVNLREQIELAGVTDDNERRRIQNNYEILRLREQFKNDGYGEQQINEAAEILRIEQARRAELLRILDIRKQVAEASDLEEDLLNKLSDLQNGNRELSEYEKTLNKINTVLKDISPQQKENLLILAQQIDAQRAYNEAYNRTYDFIRNTFDILSDTGKSFGDKMKEIFGGVFNAFKKMILDMVTAWLTSKLMKIFNFGGSGQSGGGFSLGNIFQGIFGGGGTAPFNPGSFSGGLGGGALGGVGANSSDPFGIGSPGGGGKLGTAGLAGIFGVGANILGGLIGGKAGSVLSGVGSGIATGAAIGSIIPGIGTVIGAAIGGIVGFFSSIFGSKKRKIDKQENLPKLQQGLSEALQQLRALASNKNAFLDDPQGVLAKAQELRTQIASGFGINFQSKKYRAIAQQRIAQNLVEADRIIADIKAESDRAIVAKNIDERLNANFASGAYMSPEFLKRYGDFKRRNGILAGRFTGRDNLPSMLAPGEMVLNPGQIKAVVRNAGFDAFKNAGIPGYADGGFVRPSTSGTGVPSVGSPAGNQIIFQPNITVVIEGEGISDAHIRDVFVDGLTNDQDVKVKLVESYDKTKKRTK